MIPVEQVHELVIGSSDSGDAPPHISAASSLVRHGGHLYVVADDELSLAIFDLDDLGAGHFMRILPGRLSQEKDERSEEKPDLESLALLPSFGEFGHGALFALGSGSSDKRNRGALIELGSDGGVTENHSEVKLDDLYDRLRTEVTGLNIEGAEVMGDTLWLMQRGNDDGDNALINMSLETTLQELESRELTGSAVRSVDHVDLGQIRGVQLCFSDASAMPDGRIVFAASAEDSEDETSDGATYGSALGLIDKDGSIEFVEPVDLTIKIEGIDAVAKDGTIEVLLVTDADDPKKPSPLLKAILRD